MPAFVAISASSDTSALNDSLHAVPEVPWPGVDGSGAGKNIGSGLTTVSTLRDGWTAGGQVALVPNGSGPTALRGADTSRHTRGIKQFGVPGATRLFEEPGTLKRVAVLARDWFVDQLSLVASSST